MEEKLHGVLNKYTQILIYGSYVERKPSIKNNFAFFRGGPLKQKGLVFSMFNIS